MGPRLAIIALLALAMVGCPEETEAPARTMGRSCSSHLDCVPDGGAACGSLVDCVDQVCAAEPSLVLPCP